MLQKLRVRFLQEFQPLRVTLQRFLRECARVVLRIRLQFCRCHRPQPLFLVLQRAQQQFLHLWIFWVANARVQRQVVSDVTL